MTDQKKIDNIILQAIREDVENGDITTNAIVDNSRMAKAELIVKQNGIIAGIEICKRVFKILDDDVVFTNYKFDGNKVNTGDIVATIEGKAKTILTGERTALNFLQRMSGIATTSSIYNEKIIGTNVKILDTRKTVPGLRYFDKLAVSLGGASNHRYGLFDMFLIKENHIEIAGSITKAVNYCRKFQYPKGKDFKIEVETKNLKEVGEALLCNVDIIMLDNFTTDLMVDAVQLVGGQCKVEASGGITLENLKEVAETGVDFISVGALTHSVKSLDISLLIHNDDLSQ